MPKRVQFINFRPASSAKNETAIVFVHGFTGDVAKTWRRIPEFLQADPRLSEWDLLGVGYQSNRRFDLAGLWSLDAQLEEIAIMLHARPELSPAELVGLGTEEDFQLREEHWVIADRLARGSTSGPFRFQVGRNAQSMSGLRRRASIVVRSSGE